MARKKLRVQIKKGSPASLLPLHGLTMPKLSSGSISGLTSLAMKYITPAPIIPWNGHARPSRGRKKRIRIGYISSDFKPHPIGDLMLSVIANHDATKFEVFIYSLTQKNDATSKRLSEYEKILVR